MKLDGFSDPGTRSGPVRSQAGLTVPEIHIDSEAAVEPLEQVVAGIPDYSGDNKNVVGPGELTRARQRWGMGPRPRCRLKSETTRIVSSLAGVRRAMQAAYQKR